MPPSSSAEDAPCSRAEDIDHFLERFEHAWQEEGAADIEAFVPPECRDRKHLLHELIKIDLEYCWRRSEPSPAEKNSLPACPRLDDYICRFPELGPLRKLPLELIAEEYRVRQRWGDQPRAAEYLARFPRRAQGLSAELARIDAELHEEAATLYIRGRPTTRIHARLVGPPQLDDHSHRRLGRYELRGKLGSGAFGVVWQAWDTELARDVAVKVPHSGKFANPIEEERFLREARAAAALHHPGIVAVCDVGRAGDTLYIVSELVRGKSLEECLRSKRPGFSECAELMIGVADALDHAHRQGVVHRDVKPSNIMLTSTEPRAMDTAEQPDPVHRDLDRGRPKLVDFGLALRDAGEATMTADGQMLGTPAYMSPEQIRNPHAVDGRSDVYSLGVILYELLTGELPFHGSARELFVQVVSDEPRPPRLLNGRIPHDLETICLKCLHKNPAHRYRTAGALADDLRRWRMGEPIRARSVGRSERLWLWLWRNPALVAITALASAAIVAVQGVPLAVALVAIAGASLAFALHKIKAGAELAQVLEDTRRELEKSTGMMRFAFEHCARAREERRRAVAGADQAKRRLALAQELVRSLLFTLPEEISDPCGRALLIRTALIYLDGLAKEVGDDVLLQRELAVAYSRVAELQVNRSGETADLTGTLASYRKSLDLFVALARAHPENGQAQADYRLVREKIGEIQEFLDP